MQAVGDKLLKSGLSLRLQALHVRGTCMRVVDSMLVRFLSSLTSLSVAEASVPENIFQPALQPHPQNEPTRSAAECWRAWCTHFPPRDPTETWNSAVNSFYMFCAK